MSHSSRSCNTHVAIVLYQCCSCLTRVALVSHQCCIGVARVARLWHSCCKLDQIENLKTQLALHILICCYLQTQNIGDRYSCSSRLIRTSEKEHLAAKSMTYFSQYFILNSISYFSTSKKNLLISKAENCLKSANFRQCLKSVFYVICRLRVNIQNIQLKHLEPHL